MTTEQALLVLNALPGMGPVTLRRLLEERDDDPVELLRAGPRGGGGRGVPRATARAVAEWPRHFDLAREERRLAEGGWSWLSCRHPDYPPLLRHVPDAPIGLYARGAWRGEPAGVAIVGCRAPSPYGRAVAAELSAGLARAGLCVVSGLARGVDTVAHTAAVEAGGVTVGVLGSGADIIFPPENAALFRRVAEVGAVLTEFPFGRRPDRQTFPIRNRVVAGLCSAVIVVESDEQGGAMITARFAGEYGRDVLAVPGRIDEPTSRGCHALLRDGAVLVRGVEDVLAEVTGRSPGPARVEPSPPAGPEVEAGSDEARVLAALRGGTSATPDDLALGLGTAIEVVHAALLTLELDGRVVRRPDGRYEAPGVLRARRG